MYKEMLSEKNKKTRMASIELLRCLAMLMVITLHYLSKGEILTSLSQPQSIGGYGAWLLESFCIVAVNTYVLVSGYFLVEAGFKWKRLVTLVLQVLFYSILVPVGLVFCRILPLSELTPYHLFNYVFPVQMEHYWFATAYILMYLFVPVLSAGVKQMSRVQLRNTIWLLVAVFSLSKTVLPFQLTIDKRGYDVVWFLCLFLIAAYIRLYGSWKIQKSKQGLFVYMISCLGILGLTLAFSWAFICTGKFAYILNHTMDYNHILCLFGAIGLFLTFLYWEMPEGIPARLVRKIAPYTFGVYLLHENREIRYLWLQWLGIEQYGAGKWSVVHWLFSILIVFIIGILVDYVRDLLFKGTTCLVKKCCGKA